MRKRLRPAYPASELPTVYPSTYDHTRWPDHLDRVARTIEFAETAAPLAATVADLSCGDAAIARALADHWNADCTLGDLVAGYEHHGQIEDTIETIDPVDVFICSETLEHIDNPDHLLARIRAKASRLILSTPCDETITNPEHYWAWGAADIAAMLEQAGWQPTAYQFIEYQGLDVRYQLWACR